MKCKVTLPKASKALLRLNPSGPVRCPYCLEGASVVFTVVRAQASVGKAYLCLGCFELLCELFPGCVSSVSARDFLETEVSLGERGNLTGDNGGNGVSADRM